MKRYKFFITDKGCQYLGGIGEYDVVYAPREKRLVVKYADGFGHNFIYDYGQQNWWANANGARKLETFSEEDRAVALMMKELFFHEETIQ
jgi:hypothetical protein